VAGRSLDWYDYGARFYEPEIGRWQTVDPMEQYNSPYIYAGDNPMNMIDPSGMYSYDWNTNEYKDNDGNVVSWNEVQANNYTEPQRNKMNKLPQFIEQSITNTYEDKNCTNTLQEVTTEKSASYDGKILVILVNTKVVTLVIDRYGKIVAISEKNNSNFSEFQHNNNGTFTLVSKNNSPEVMYNGDDVHLSTEMNFFVARTKQVIKDGDFSLSFNWSNNLIHNNIDPGLGSSPTAHQWFPYLARTVAMFINYLKVNHIPVLLLKKTKGVDIDPKFILDKGIGVNN
jgi:RHS repeat-associated core domain